MLKQFHVLLHDTLYQSSQIVSHGEQHGLVLIILNIRLLWLHNHDLQEEPSSGKNVIISAELCFLCYQDTI